MTTTATTTAKLQLKVDLENGQASIQQQPQPQDDLVPRREQSVPSPIHILADHASHRGDVGTPSEQSPLLPLSHPASCARTLPTPFDDSDSDLSLGSIDRHYKDINNHQQYFDQDDGDNNTSILSLSSSTRSLQRSLSDAWDSYNGALDRRPLVVKSITAALLLGLGDVCGQLVGLTRNEHAMTVETRDASTSTSTSTTTTTTMSLLSSLDVARTLRFALMGLVLQAPFSHYYYHWLDRVLPPTREPFLTGSFYLKLAIDQLIQAPFFLCLIFLFLGVLEQLMTLSSSSSLSFAVLWTQLHEQYVPTLWANWKLWVPAQTINIAFCPMHLRVLFLNIVFFAWSIVLSVFVK